MFYQLFSKQPKEKNHAFLVSYLHDFGYRNIKLEEIYHYHEHDECFYYKGFTSEGLLFIKITPRIANEIRHQHFLNQKKFSFVLPTLFGTSSDKDILITKAIDQPHFMTQQVNKLINGEITLDAFLSSEMKVLSLIKQIHDSDVSETAIFPNYKKFLSYTYDQLLKEIDIISLSIELDGKTLPSIKVMIENVLEKKLPPVKGCLIHGEFSHTNVGYDHNLVIYDWEKMRWQGDACWDIAKWIKYFHYFYFVEKVRGMEIKEKLMHVRDNKLYIKRLFPDFPYKKEIIKEITRQFTCSKERVDTALFLSNLYSLRKAAQKYSHTLPLMITAIATSYSE